MLLLDVTPLEDEELIVQNVLPIDVFHKNLHAVRMRQDA